MIQKLRRKFIVILMSVVTLIISALFIILLASTYYRSYKISMNMMNEALLQPSRIQGFPKNMPAPSTRLQDMPPLKRVPVIVAYWDGKNFTVESEQYMFLDENELQSAIEKAFSQQKSSGLLQGYGLRFLKSQDGKQIALIDITRDQQLMSSLLLTSSLIWAASFLGFLGVSILLSRWAVKPAEQAWIRQKQFVADASHELKTPLTVILSNAEMLIEDTSINSPKAQNRISHIHAEAGQMKQLINKMIELAKNDDGTGKAQFTKVNFSEIVQRVYLMQEPVFYDGGKTLQESIQQNLFVNGDRQRLQELVSILLDNAYKYSRPESTVTVTLIKDDKSKLILKVASFGEPIPKESLDKIFARFFQLDSSRSGTGSFGLGLAIAQGIVSSHDGTIWAESNEQINTFLVSLPILKNSDI